jgi:hypothetical protein
VRRRRRPRVHEAVTGAAAVLGRRGASDVGRRRAITSGCARGHRRTPSPYVLPHEVTQSLLRLGNVTWHPKPLVYRGNPNGPPFVKCGIVKCGPCAALSLEALRSPRQLRVGHERRQVTWTSRCRLQSCGRSFSRLLCACVVSCRPSSHRPPRHAERAADCEQGRMRSVHDACTPLS